MGAQNYNGVSRGAYETTPCMWVSQLERRGGVGEGGRYCVNGANQIFDIYFGRSST